MARTSRKKEPEKPKKKESTRPKRLQTKAKMPVEKKSEPEVEQAAPSFPSTSKDWVNCKVSKV